MLYPIPPYLITQVGYRSFRQTLLGSPKNNTDGLVAHLKILIADDHALFLDGLAQVLLQLGDDVEILPTRQADQVLEMVTQHPDLDLALLDLKMPGSDGVSLQKAISHETPFLPIVILSASEDRQDMLRALESGAMGYIPKSSSPAIILSALRLILAGGKYIPSELMSGPIGEGLPIKKQGVSLTPRQQEVLKFIIEGSSNKQIAAHLNCTEGTVKVHVTAVLKALGVNNRTQAAVAAQQLGLLLD